MSLIISLIIIHAQKGSFMFGSRGFAACKSLTRKFACAGLSFVLAMSLCGVVPAAAYAGEGSSEGSSDDSTGSQYSFITGKTTDAAFFLTDPTKTDTDFYTNLASPAGIPASDESLITSVKSQNPWGSCWAFASIAASETSILAKQRDQGQEAKANSIDLSELALAWWAYSTVPESYAGAAQAGEGFYTTADKNSLVDAGGYPEFASALFAAGVGPTTEDDVPYLPLSARNGQTDKISYVCKVYYSNQAPVTRCLTDSMISEIEKEQNVTKVDKLYYSSRYETGEDDEGRHLTAYDDWSVPESKYADQAYELSESFLLGDMVTKDESGNYQSTNQDTIKAVKEQLVNGRAVTTGFSADTSQPGQEAQAKYINMSTWAHYTYEDAQVTHAVTIVGWDDNYSKENFLDGKQPPADGAWLVKNSWGSETENTGADENGIDQNLGDWGITDEDGKHTGYFWLSYYDHTISMLEAFDFDINHTLTNTIESQYDYMQYVKMLGLDSETEVSSANVFTADQDIRLRSVTCQTVKPNTHLAFDVYLLDDDAVNESGVVTNPTKGTKVSLTESGHTYETDYETAGYHRYLPDEDSWIAMRSGQKYSVVVTQYTTDDTGKKTYYQAAGANTGYPSDELVEKYRQMTKERLLNQDLASFKGYWQTQLMDGGLTQAEAEEALGEYKAALIEEGTSEAEAKAECDALLPYMTAAAEGTHMPEADAEAAAEKYAKAITNTKDYTDYLDNEVEQQIEKAKMSYHVAKVNEGESFSCANGTWIDWTQRVEEITAIPEYADFAIDNAPIKTFADKADMATVASLDELKAKIDEAKALLESVVISADGTDVPAGKQWMTQEAYDALKAAAERAEAILALAGSDWHSTVATTTPDQDTVDECLAALTWQASEGTASTDENNDTTKSNSKKETVTKPATASPATGDFAFGGLLALMTAAAAGSVVAFSRRKMNE